MITEFCFGHILEVEGSLMDAKVFIGGISGKTASPDAYMTIVDFSALEKWTKEKKFPPEQLAYCCEYWKNNPNCGAAVKLVAAIAMSVLEASAAGRALGSN